MSFALEDNVTVSGPALEGTEVQEKAVLVAVDLPGQDWPVQTSLDELARLADTAGVVEVGRITQKMQSPNPRSFIGPGKLEELRDLAQCLEADVVIFDDELTPAQQSSVEKAVGKKVKVIDRTALILDIFALHATSKEGRLQVRLAQNQYLLPRLRGMWSHLASNRMGGGVGSRFGEGESQLEVDRRMVRKRISSIKRQLEHLSEVRDVQRERRYESATFKISLAGYTNAGKSSLLNALTDADVLSYDKLFATLDSTTRRLALPEGREVTLSDTVGFIQKLPHTLVEAFKSTLDEIRGSDFILHVVDASSPDFERQIDAVEEVFAQIKVEKIPRIMVFNKCDLLEPEAYRAFSLRFPDALLVSSLTGDGLDRLIKAIEKAAAASDVLATVLIPYDKGNLVSIAHSKCRVLTEEYVESGTKITFSAPDQVFPLFRDYLCDAGDGARDAGDDL